VSQRYAELMGRVRDLGVALSDRRAIKVMKLVADSAVLCGRSVARECDLWPLRYVWDREEQTGPLRALVDGVLDSAPDEPDAHVLANVPERVDADELARAISAVDSELRASSMLSLAAMARIRERLSDLSDRASWLVDDNERRHLQKRAGELLELVDGQGR
jgi:MoxR-like ATPase